MDCSKSWKLMMQKADGLAKESESSDLDDHISRCACCRERWENLQTAICELEAINFEAPPNIEKSVMSRLCLIKRNEESGIMPYVVSPVAILAGLLAIFMFNTYKAGPVTMFDEAARILSIILNTLSTVSSVFERILRIPYLAQALIVFSILSAAGVAAYILKHARSNGNRVNWRVSK